MNNQKQKGVFTSMKAWLKGGLIFMFLNILLVPTVLAEETIFHNIEAYNEMVRNQKVFDYIVYISWIIYALMIIFYLFLIFKGKIMKNLSYWLKGGLSLLILDFLFWLILSIQTYIYVLILDLGSDMAGLALILIPVYGVISLIPAFILGALIGTISGKIVKGEGISISKGWKIGFWIGLIVSILFMAGNVYDKIQNLPTLGAPSWTWYFSMAPGGYFLMVGFPVVGIIIGTIIGWIIGKRN